MSSPDWWMRGVTRLGRRNAPLRVFSGSASKKGGAKNGAGHKAERRAEPRLTKGEHKTRTRESLVVVPGCQSYCSWLSRSCCSWSEGQSESVQSRDPAGGTERLPFPSPDPERRQFPPIRAEVAAENPSISPKPRPSCRARDTSNARHEPVDHARGTRSSGRAKEDSTTRSGTSRLPFLLGFCVTVYGWRQSCEVVLHKCLCAVNNCIIRLYICVVPCLCFFTVIINTCIACFV